MSLSYARIEGPNTPYHPELPSTTPPPLPPSPSPSTQSSTELQPLQPLPASVFKSSLSRSPQLTSTTTPPPFPPVPSTQASTEVPPLQPLPASVLKSTIPLSRPPELPSTTTTTPPLPLLTSTQSSTELPPLQPLPASVFNNTISNKDQNAKSYAIGMLVGRFYTNPKALELCQEFNKRIATEKAIKPQSQEVIENHLTARRNSISGPPKPPKTDLEKEICKLSDGLCPFPLSEIEELCKEFNKKIDLQEKPQNSTSTSKSVSVRPRGISASAPTPPPLTAHFQSQLAAIVRRQSQINFSAAPPDENKIQK